MAYHHEWSQSYMKDYQLTWEEHHMNNEWFNNMINRLTPVGKLYVPLIDKAFNRLGEEVNHIEEDKYYNKEEKQSYLDSLLTTGYNE